MSNSYYRIGLLPLPVYIDGRWNTCAERSTRVTFTLLHCLICMHFKLLSVCVTAKPHNLDRQLSILNWCLRTQNTPFNGSIGSCPFQPLVHFDIIIYKSVREKTTSICRVPNKHFPQLYKTMNLHKVTKWTIKSIIHLPWRLSLVEFGGWRRWWCLFKARENSHTDFRCLKWEGSMTVAAAGGCFLSPPSRDRQAAPPLVSSSLRYPDLKWLTSVWTWLRVICRQWYRLSKPRIMRQICGSKWHFSLILMLAECRQSSVGTAVLAMLKQYRLSLTESTRPCRKHSHM